MTMPHSFPSLVDGHVQVVLIAGTGLSTPEAPTVDRLKDKLTEVGSSLGVSVNIEKTHDDYFYILAEAVLKKLTEDDGKPEPESRLWLAEQLGMLDDRRWFGEIGLPLSGNTPRHRAIARFAVEGRFRAIVSLNWDTLLEAALESVGLSENPRNPRPWGVTAHARIVDDIDKPQLADPHVFPVIKPHGCVRNLERARRNYRSTRIAPQVTFKLAKTDLNNLRPSQQPLIDAKVQDYVSDCPLIAVGWKATEQYLRDAVVGTARRVKRKERDAFTLVNRSWYPSAGKPETYHDEIALAYSKTEAECFVAVSNMGQPTHDQLFQWLQARYAITRMIPASSAPEQAELRKILVQLDSLDWGSPVISWVDCWLPIWIRLCWRTGVMVGNDPHTGKKIEPWDIPVIPRDVHVPLGGMVCERCDLQAAARCLIDLVPIMKRFNFIKFPGAFWDTESHYLYLPLPGWRGSARSADLAALTSLVESLRNWGFVRRLQLIYLDKDARQPDQAFCRELEAQVRRLMPISCFASKDALSWVSIDALKGGSNAAVA